MLLISCALSIVVFTLSIDVTEACLDSRVVFEFGLVLEYAKVCSIGIGHIVSWHLF